jgi:hypothetical protein
VHKSVHLHIRYARFADILCGLADAVSATPPDDASQMAPAGEVLRLHEPFREYLRGGTKPADFARGLAQARR